MPIAVLVVGSKQLAMTALCATDDVESDAKEAVQREVRFAGTDEDGSGVFGVDGDRADRKRTGRIH